MSKLMLLLNKGLASIDVFLDKGVVELRDALVELPIDVLVLPAHSLSEVWKSELPRKYVCKLIVP